MEKIDKFVLCWYSKIVFNTLNNSTKLIFRMLETETRKLTAKKLHQKFNEICLKENLLPTYTNIYIYIYIYISKFLHIYIYNMFVCMRHVTQLEFHVRPCVTSLQ